MFILFTIEKDKHENMWRKIVFVFLNLNILKKRRDGKTRV